MTPEQSLELNFRETLGLPEDASKFLLDLWDTIQTLDDWADGDHVTEKERDKAIWNALVGIQVNSFYARNQAMLIPALAQSVLKWMASDRAEKAGMADERSYMWRAGYFDVVCLVSSLVHGPSSEMAWKALSLYGETCAEYMKEFHNA